jgi:hypothetical protein
LGEAAAVIEQTDKRLMDWAANIADGVTISLSPPNDTQTGRGVSLYLLELAPQSPAGNTRRLPLQLSLRYLVTTWADTPEEAHRLLGNLAFAAMESTEFEVELEPIPLTAWAAFHAIPRPAFVMRMPLRVERPEPSTKLVRKPMVLKAALVASLYGVVLTPDDVPLAGATVEFPALQLTERTDTKGHFRFPAIPAEPATRQLRVKAKGRELDVTVDQSGSEHEPLVIHFDIKE